MALVLAYDVNGDFMCVAMDTPLPPGYKAVDVEFNSTSGKSRPKKRRARLFVVKDGTAR